MSKQAGGIWYVRKRGQILGPYDAAQLKHLRDRGQIARYHELSEDKHAWQSAEEMGLFAPARAAEPVAVAEVAVGEAIQAVSMASATVDPFAVRRLRLSLGMLTMGYVLEVSLWIIVAFIWFLAYLSENPHLYEASGFIIIGSVMATNILLIIGYAFACGTFPLRLSAGLPVTCLVLQIIDFLCVLFGIILLAIAAAPFEHWRTQLAFNTGFLIVNGLRFFLAIAVTITLLEWLRACGYWIARTSPHADFRARSLVSQINAFYFLYALQNFLVLILTVILFLVSSRGEHNFQEVMLNQKLSVIFLVLFAIYMMSLLASAIWRVILLSIAWRGTDASIAQS
jgi:hypothetical protein